MSCRAIILLIYLPIVSLNCTMNKRVKITVPGGVTAPNPLETQALWRGGNFLCAGHGPCAPAANFIVYKARGRVKISSQKMKEFSVGGHCVSRPPTLRGERSRPRGGLTLPISSGSGNEHTTSQKAAPAGAENDNIMTNKLIHARSGIIPYKKGNINEGVELIEKLSEIYAQEFREIKTKKDAIRWIDSIPRGYEKPILATLAFDMLRC